MSARRRTYVGLAVLLVLAFLFSRMASAWSDLGYYAGVAGIGIAFLAVALPWIDMAPDGALGRRRKA